MRRLKFTWQLLLLLAFASVAYAQEEPGTEVTDDQVNRVARELYCPICENTPLDVCETQACQDWRVEIREQLEAGRSDQEIIEYFADIYGERARATPTMRGFSKWVWIAAIGGAILSTLFFALVMRRWLARGAAVPSSTPQLDEQRGDEPDVDEYVARLEREIRETP